MAKALPKAQGLQIISGLRSAKGLDLQFTPSLAIIAGRMDKLGLDIRSFREPLKRSIQQVVIPSIKKNFAVGGRPPWQPLSPKTIERKGHAKKLINTGSLKRTMGTFQIWTVTKNYAVITDLPNSIWYGKVHQAGAGSVSESLRVIGTGAKAQSRSVSFSEGGIPARPFVLLQKSDERAVERIFRRWLDERVQARMGRL